MVIEANVVLVIYNVCVCGSGGGGKVLDGRNKIQVLELTFLAFFSAITLSPYS